MVRTIIYMLVSVVVISLLSGVIRLIKTALGELFEAEKSGGSSQRSASTSFGGELKKDPVCGTFVSPANSLQKSLSGQVYYFCSPTCRDKFTTA